MFRIHTLARQQQQAPSFCQSIMPKQHHVLRNIILTVRRYTTENEEPANSKESNPKELTSAAQLAEKDGQIAELQDLYRRSMADSENLRNRTQREMKDKEVFVI